MTDECPKRMLKAWNREHGKLRSFHLEAMVREILAGVTISDYASGARFVFDRARATIGGLVLDPAGYGGHLASYLDTQTKRDDVVSRLNSAYARAQDAEALAGAGRIYEAVENEKWRIVFGRYFPAYG